MPEVDPFIERIMPSHGDLAFTVPDRSVTWFQCIAHERVNWLADASRLTSPCWFCEGLGFQGIR